MKSQILSKKSNVKTTIIKIFSRISEIHKMKGDRYRARAYDNGIRIVRNYSGNLPNNKKDLQAIKGIGKGLSEKMEEIIKTNKLAKLEEMEKDDTLIGIQNLEKVVGIGPKFIQKLLKLKIQSVPALKQAYEKGDISLNNQQILGITYFDDLNKKIPRKDIISFEKELNKIVSSIDNNLNFVITGSYRRKIKESGDIDILLSHNNVITKTELKQLRKNYIDIIVEKLDNKFKKVGTLAKGLSKYMGLHKINNKIRHVDIIFMPMESYYSAILYFTGSKEHNIKMREKAKNMGHTLNEWGLIKANKSRFKITSEKDLFDILNIDYLEPEDR